MNTLEALYFPGTEIYSGSQFPVFLLFQKLHLIQPVESPDTADNCADIFITAGLCQAHTPCPLGQDRDRFLHLIRDIRERKDDYASQLSSLTVASMSAKKPSIDDTQHGIISTLQGNHHLSSQPEDKTTELLWQARLVLKIGEILDHEEEEVAVQLTLLGDQEEDLFKALQGEIDDEEETLFAELQYIREKKSRPSAAAVKNRLAAWNRLYLADTVAEPTTWLTHMVETADILLEKYENATSSPAPVIAEFELPANIGWSKDEAVGQIRDFQQDNSGLLGEIATAISKHSPAELKPLAVRWAAALDNAFPRENTGRTRLTLHYLTDISCGALLGKTESAGTTLAVVRWLD